MIDESEQRWLIQKGRLDFGPFSLQEIKRQIDANEILPEHTIIDNDSGKRGKIAEHPLLGDMVHAAAARRDEHRRVNAEATMVKQDRRRGAALYLVIALGVAAIGAGGYFGLKKLRAADKKGPSELAALEGAELNVTIELKPQAPRGTGKKRTGGARPGEAGAKGGWDDSLDLGDASDDDGDSERLDNATLSKVIQSSGRGLGACLAGSGSRKAEIEFIVAGSGKVTSVRVNGDTDSGLANCIRKKMQAMQFPSFNGPRTRGSFEMSI